MTLRILHAGCFALTLALMGLAIPAQEAQAHTICHVYRAHGVQHRHCRSTHRHHQTVCRFSWHHGVRYRHCWRP